MNESKEIKMQLIGWNSNPVQDPKPASELDQSKNISINFVTNQKYSYMSWLVTYPDIVKQPLNCES